MWACHPIIHRPYKTHSRKQEIRSTQDMFLCVCVFQLKPSTLSRKAVRSSDKSFERFGGRHNSVLIPRFSPSLFFSSRAAKHRQKNEPKCQCVCVCGKRASLALTHSLIQIHVVTSQCLLCRIPLKQTHTHTLYNPAKVNLD